MKKLPKILLILVLTFSMILSFSIFTFADEDETWPSPPDDLISGSIYMVEVNTGAVFYEKDAYTQRYPASTTKIMTALIALETCSLNETITFSETAVALDSGDSNIGAVAGEQMSLKDCLYGLMLASGNECGNAIAEHIAGSVSAFADLMNAKAEELGCQDTHFTNPHGLFDKEHYTTAYDLSLIAQAAFNNSAFCEIVSQASYTIGPTNMYAYERDLTNTNYLIIPSSAYYNEYVIGGKTGYLYESGRCLVSMAKKDGISVITVALYCPNYYGVFTDTNELLDYVFSNFKMENITETEPRFNFAEKNAKIELDTAGLILMPSAISTSDLDSTMQFTADLDSDTLQTLKDETGITGDDGRKLYGVISYYYADHYLGKVNVILNDNLEIKETAYASVIYISGWYFVLLGVVIILILVMIKIISERKRAAARRALRARRYKYRRR